MEQEQIKSNFWKSGKPMILLALACFVMVLVMAFYGHSLENKYNDLVVKYNECQEGFYDTYEIQDQRQNPGMILNSLLKNVSGNNT